ncbi:MAG: hypothetical protein Q4D02_06345 [Clostridia bacterium]|nr:hypothetical protein [Clostridia bacterium]
MNKKEFKKKCKEEKARSYFLCLFGAIISCIGLAVVFGTLLLDLNLHLFTYPIQILFYVIGVMISLIGMTLDLLGEVEFSKKFKEHISKNEK